jgi:D-tagatose-1,6-bisphosphate aldolase subunit GatZ/KbaZ
MNAILDVVERHRSGTACGIYSLCSAHPLVIRADLLHAMQHGAGPVLIEATCNQVNQEGGYTGMVPAGFRDFVHAIAAEVGFPRARLVLGGDHLGPHPWQDLPAAEAMARAEELVAAYVMAGFRKIHLDCSMACADDASPLDDETIARRSARLCRAAELAWQSVGGEAPVYVIGTEVPVPGGATHALQELNVTTPAAARATIEAHCAVFAAAGLQDAWARVVAAVVQPGVEFDHGAVVDYVPAKARALADVVLEHPRFVFEAHSTDYQQPRALAQLVRDHFAILKVGPAATFALREALWALDAIEREWIAPGRAAHLRQVTLACMRSDPRHWARHYAGSEADKNLLLDYSLSDRIRYYWNRPEVVAAQEKLFANLVENPPPAALLSQYFPESYLKIRSGQLASGPQALVVERIGRVLDDYWAACQATEVTNHA